MVVHTHKYHRLLQGCWLNNTVNRIVKIAVSFNLSIMFQHIVYSLVNRQGLFAYVRTCKTRLDTTTKFMVVVTSLFNLVNSSLPDNTLTTLLIYHDGSNNVVQVCSFIKPWTVCSNMHEQACQQPCSSWPAQPCSRWPAQPCSRWPAQPCSSLSTKMFKLASSTMFKMASSTMFKMASSTMFKPVNGQKQAVLFDVCSSANLRSYIWEIFIPLHWDHT